MNALRALWQVAVDLIVGDDPKIAVAVVVTLVVEAALLLAGVGGTIIAVGGAVLVAAVFGGIVAFEVRRSLAARGD